MKIDVDPKLAENPAWAAALGQANQFVATLPGPATSESEATWYPSAKGSEQAELELRFPDPQVSVRRSFARADLQDQEVLERHLLHYWRDFLGDVSRKLGERVRAQVALLEDD